MAWVAVLPYRYTEDVKITLLGLMTSDVTVPEDVHPKRAPISNTTDGHFLRRGTP